MVRQSTELEVNMNAVERVIEYTKLTPEKPPIIATHRPPQGWPSQGVVEAQDLVVRYREDLDPVLKHINFKTQPHEKIGVVGRTGVVSSLSSPLVLACFIASTISAGLLVCIQSVLVLHSRVCRSLILSV